MDENCKNDSAKNRKSKNFDLDTSLNALFTRWLEDRNLSHDSAINAAIYGLMEMSDVHREGLEERLSHFAVDPASMPPDPIAFERIIHTETQQ